MAESQTLRSFSISFPDKYDVGDFGFKSEPKIIDRVKAKVKCE